MKLTSKNLRSMILKEMKLVESAQSTIESFSEAAWRVAEELGNMGWDANDISSRLKDEVDGVMEGFSENANDQADRDWDPDDDDDLDPLEHGPLDGDLTNWAA
jgi:hypothetical protein